MHRTRKGRRAVPVATNDRRRGRHSIITSPTWPSERCWHPFIEGFARGPGASPLDRRVPVGVWYDRTRLRGARGLVAPELSGTRGSGRSDRSRNAFSATLFGTFLEQLASQWIIFSNLIRGSDGSQVLRKDERLGGRGRGSSARCEWAEHACAHCAHRRRLTSRGSS